MTMRAIACIWIKNHTGAAFMSRDPCRAGGLTARKTNDGRFGAITRVRSWTPTLRSRSSKATQKCMLYLSKGGNNANRYLDSEVYVAAGGALQQWVLSILRLSGCELAGYGLELRNENYKI